MAERIMPFTARKNAVLLAGQVGDIINAALQAADVLEALAKIPDLAKRRPALAGRATDAVEEIHGTASAFFTPAKQ